MIPPGKIEQRSHADTPTREDTPFIQGRLNMLVLAFSIVMAVFAMRIYRLSILEGTERRRETEENFLREESIAAPRGRILDRNGKPLAINRTVFRVEMAPLRLGKDAITSTVAAVARLVNRPAVNLKAKEVIAKRPRENSVPIATGLTLDQVLPLLEERFQLPGVTVHTSYERVYPEGEIAGGITGHVAKIPPEEYDAFRQEGYLSDEVVGRNNAERTFETILRGTPGTERLKRDHLGRTRERKLDKPVEPGDTIYLTIDLGMQRLAKALLGDWEGFILAMDPRDGAVLAMAYNPDYDPNFTPASLAKKRSQYNMIYQGTGFAPGSTFKIVTASAGLMAGFPSSDVINCGGYTTLGKTRFYCDQRWGHDDENFSDAMTHSCNIYFYTWGRRVGANLLTKMARGFGFGAPTEFELAPLGLEKPGHVANPDVDTIQAGSVMHMAIGQGEMIGVTPIQMGRAYSAMCNGGLLMRPRIVHRICTADDRETTQIAQVDGGVWEVGKPVVQGRIPVNAEARRTVTDGLFRVTHDAHGTGRHAAFPLEWSVAGKTGTAQTGRPIPDGWFVCYAPAEAPRIVIVVLIKESGHGGTIAAPLARQILAYDHGKPEPAVVAPPRATPAPAAIAQN